MMTRRSSPSSSSSSSSFVTAMVLAMFAIIAVVCAMIVVIRVDASSFAMSVPFNNSIAPAGVGRAIFATTAPTMSTLMYVSNIDGQILSVDTALMTPSTKINIIVAKVPRALPFQPTSYLGTYAGPEMGIASSNMMYIINCDSNIYSVNLNTAGTQVTTVVPVTVTMPIPVVWLITIVGGAPIGGVVSQFYIYELSGQNILLFDSSMSTLSVLVPSKVFSSFGVPTAIVVDPTGSIVPPTAPAPAPYGSWLNVWSMAPSADGSMLYVATGINTTGSCIYALPLTQPLSAMSFVMASTGGVCGPSVFRHTVTPSGTFNASLASITLSQDDTIILMVDEMSSSVYAMQTADIIASNKNPTLLPVLNYGQSLDPNCILFSSDYSTIFVTDDMNGIEVISSGCPSSSIVAPTHGSLTSASIDSCTDAMPMEFDSKCSQQCLGGYIAGASASCAIGTVANAIGGINAGDSTSSPTGTGAIFTPQICVACAANTYSIAGAKSCTACPSGQWSQSGASSCSPVLSFPLPIASVGAAFCTAIQPAPSTSTLLYISNLAGQIVSIDTATAPTTSTSVTIVVAKVPRVANQPRNVWISRDYFGPQLAFGSNNVMYILNDDNRIYTISVANAGVQVPTSVVLSSSVIAPLANLIAITAGAPTSAGVINTFFLFDGFSQSVLLFSSATSVVSLLMSTSSFSQYAYGIHLTVYRMAASADAKVLYIASGLNITSSCIIAVTLPSSPLSASSVTTTSSGACGFFPMTDQYTALVTGLAINPSSDTLVVSENQSGTIFSIGAADIRNGIAPTPTRVAKFGIQDADGIVYSRDGSTIYIADDQAGLVVVSTACISTSIVAPTHGTTVGNCTYGSLMSLGTTCTQQCLGGYLTGALASCAISSVNNTAGIFNFWDSALPPIPTGTAAIFTPQICTACAANTYALAGAKVCTVCATGTTSQAGSSACAATYVPSPISLASCGRRNSSFSVLSGTATTAAGPHTSILTGRAGASPIATAWTGDISANQYATTSVPYEKNTLLASRCRTDISAAFAQGVGLTGYTLLAKVDLAGVTLTAGRYYSAAAISIGSGSLTLDGKGDIHAQFVFKAGSTLITAAATNVILINGASSHNVFWIVGSSATLGSGSSIVGTIIAYASITAGTTARVQGRLFAGAAVTFAGGNTVDNTNVVSAVTTPTTTPTTPVVTPVTPTTPAAVNFPNVASLCAAAPSSCPSTFALFAGSALTFGASNSIVGDYASYPTPAITGVPALLTSGTNRALNKDMIIVENVIIAAYKALAALCPAGSTTIPTELGGRTLTPGIYCAAGGVFNMIAGSTLTLAPQPAGSTSAFNQYIFVTATSFITGASCNIVADASVDASNIVFAIGTSLTTGASNHIVGTVVAAVSATIGASSVIRGRILVQIAITLGASVKVSIV